MQKSLNVKISNSNGTDSLCCLYVRLNAGKLLKPNLLCALLWLLCWYLYRWIAEFLCLRTSRLSFGVVTSSVSGENFEAQTWQNHCFTLTISFKSSEATR